MPRSSSLTMTLQAQRRLIVMLKYPQAGKVKTRLIPVLGDEGACDLYRALVRRTLKEVERLRSEVGVSVELRVAGAPDIQSARGWVGAGYQIADQCGDDLGWRMENAAREAFEKGSSAVVIIGADCPEMEARHLEAAFGALEHKDVVLGPAKDGGYYLVGMRRLFPELFADIQWSTALVLEQTLSAIRGARLEYKLLECLHDVDRPEDLSIQDRRLATEGSQ